MNKLIVLFGLICFALLVEDIPPLKPKFKELGDEKLKDTYCKRKFEKKCWTLLGKNQCLGVGIKSCISLTKGAKISSIFFLIRNGLFPFFTVGSHSFTGDISEQGGLNFVKNANRFSLLIYGFFEYKKMGKTSGSPAFRPKVDGDVITAQYLFNKQGTKFYKALNWLKMKEPAVTFTGSSGEKVYSFTLQPDFAKLDDTKKLFPRFAISAYVTTDTVEEEGKKGKLKNVVLDPSSLKLAINVTNAGCKNSTSSGFGIAMVMATKSKMKRKGTIDNKNPDTDFPDSSSDTNEVYNIEGDIEGSDGGFISFQRKLQGRRRNGTSIDGGKYYIDFLGIDTIKEKAKGWVHFNDTTNGAYGLVGRSLDVVWLSIPDCNVTEFYWDPSVGYASEGDEETSGGSSYVFFVVICSIVLMFL